MTVSALLSLLSDVLVAEAEGVGSASSSEPESDEEVSPSPEVAVAEGLGSVSSADSEALAEADGVALADASVPSSAPSRSSTQAWYSSAVRLFEVVGWSSALASVGVRPMPMRTAVGMAAKAIALPAGMWNLVDNGFLGAA